EDDDADASDVDSRPPGCLRVASDCVDVPAESGSVRDVGPEHQERHDDYAGERQPPPGVRIRLVDDEEGDRGNTHNLEQNQREVADRYASPCPPDHAAERHDG